MPARQVVFIAAQGPRVGPRLAGAMAAQPGYAVLLADDEALADAAPDTGMAVVPAGFESRAAVAAAFDAALKIAGPPAQLIVSILPTSAMQARSIVETDDVQWQTACKALVRGSLYCLQAAGSHMKGGSIVVLGPAFSLCGSAGLVPLSTAAEAQRGLVKSAARQWGARGFRVNWVGIAAMELATKLSEAALPFRPERIPVALGRRPAIDEIAPILAFLAGDAGSRITGASINADGGEWMLP